MRTTEDKKKIINSLTHVGQIGIVVKDVDAIECAMERIFGVKPDYRGLTPDLERYYKGNRGDFAAKMIFYTFANIELEFIQPIQGESDWTHFMENGREGLHHFRFSVDNWKDTVEGLAESGIPILMEGRSVKGGHLRWGVMDTEKELTFNIEIFNEFEAPPEIE